MGNSFPPIMESSFIPTVIVSIIMVIGVLAYVIYKEFMKSKMKNAQENYSEGEKYYLLFENPYDIGIIGCIGVMLMTSFINFGFYHLLFSLFIVCHTVLFFIVNHYSIRKFKQFKILKVLMGLSFATYVATYLLLPDVIDEFSMSVLRIIENKTIVDYCYKISHILFAINIAIMGVQFFIICLKQKLTKKRNLYREGI